MVAYYFFLSSSSSSCLSLRITTTLMALALASGMHVATPKLVFCGPMSVNQRRWPSRHFSSFRSVAAMVANPLPHNTSSSMLPYESTHKSPRQVDKLSIAASPVPTPTRTHHTTRMAADDDDTLEWVQTNNVLMPYNFIAVVVERSMDE
jgi:hypothetical protein